MIFALRWSIRSIWIALSFVRTANEVLELKSLIKNQSAFGRTTPVIAKIEKPEAIDNIDAIIEAADAIMIARGDLGIETSPETVPMVQKIDHLQMSPGRQAGGDRDADARLHDSQSTPYPCRGR